MSTKHTVLDGDHVTKIARRAGFKTYRRVWDDSENDALRTLRKNANVLAPGDIVIVPDFVSRDEAAVTGIRHVFHVASSALRLRLVLRGYFDEPLVRATGTLDVEGDGKPVLSDGIGLVERPIPFDAESGRLEMGPFHADVRIGFLHPGQLAAGQAARLDNLGYEVGVGDPDARRSAIEEFQCDAGLPVTGVVDATTEEALMRTHGC